MKKKIFSAVFFVSIIMVLITMILMSIILNSSFTHFKKNELQDELDLIAKAVNINGDGYLDSLKNNSYRITLISDNGKVLFDNEIEKSNLGDHSNRPEVKEAIENSQGSSIRYSHTMFTSYIYVTEKLNNGNILRLSIATKLIWNIIFSLIPYAILVIILTILLSLYISSRLAKIIIKPITEVDLSNPLESKGYDEIAPLLRHIRDQQKKITKQDDKLNKKDNEFTIIVKSMKEGLVVLDKNSRVLYINPSATKIFQCDNQVIGHQFMEVSRELEINEMLKQAIIGNQSSCKMSMGTGIYKISFTPILYNDKIAGAIMLLVDITEKEQSEAMRREFTANVSHELKTPLHSLLGCSELLLNNMVKEEDRERFYNQIYNETKRMIKLVEDIIELSNLDEMKLNEEFQVLDLSTFVYKIRELLESEAKSKDITISLDIQSVEIKAIPSMLEAIIYNIFDNAIKYNNVGGSISVIVKKENNKGILIIKDTGIGIPKEAQARVFERFYRVDKSRSKSVGGTGLGLSIVKHMAKLSRAELQLKSEVNIGTEVEVAFQQADSSLSTN